MKTLEFIRLNAPWLGAGALLTFLSSFGQTFFISLFADRIMADFALSHGAWGGIYTLGTTASAIVMIWAGALTDHFRARVLGMVILGLLALACLSMAFNHAVWFLPLVIFALRFTGQGMTSHIAVVAMVRWFVAARGRALSIATIGFAIGESLLPLIFVSLLAVFDWRMLWLIAAALALMGILPLRHLLRTERTPQSIARETQSVGMHGFHWTRAQCLRHPLFWFMIPALLGPAAFNTAFFFLQTTYAKSIGWDHLSLVAFFPLYTGMTVVSMMASGWMLDRIGTARLLPLYQAPMVVSFLSFALWDSVAGVVVGFVGLAISTGANSTLPNAFWAEFYGTRHLGSIKAMAAAVMVFGSAIGPGITGIFLDLGVSLQTQFAWIAAYFVLVCVITAVGVARARPSLPAAA